MPVSVAPQAPMMAALPGGTTVRLGGRVDLRVQPIARQLVITERTVETHMRAIFRKLNIDGDEGSHRRVRVALAHLTHHSRAEVT